jgi:hypothetical protein
MTTFTKELTKETIRFFKKESKKPETRRTFTFVIDMFVGTAVTKLQPYMYTIIAILIIIFLINLFQFYYYVRVLTITLDNNKNGIAISDYQKY